MPSVFDVGYGSPPKSTKSDFTHELCKFSRFVMSKDLGSQSLNLHSYSDSVLSLHSR